MNCQIVHDCLHERGFTDCYAIHAAGELAGYGSLVGFDRGPKETVKEFFVLPAQTNDRLLMQMVDTFAERAERRTILFVDSSTTSRPARGREFRRIQEPRTGTSIWKSRSRTDVAAVAVFWFRN